MGFRFQKRIRLLPGIRLNLSKTGASVTVGKTGLSVNLSKDGATGNVGIPGTGLAYREKISSSSMQAQELAPIEQEDEAHSSVGGAGIWKWLFFAALLMIIVLIASR